MAEHEAPRVVLVKVEKNAAYVDLKFRRIEGAYPGIRCVAVVEAAQAEPLLVREYVEGATEHADVVCCS